MGVTDSVKPKVTKAVGQLGVGGLLQGAWPLALSSQILTDNQNELAE
jgi:hypothetical protein